jgi:hypothetical protein
MICTCLLLVTCSWNSYLKIKNPSTVFHMFTYNCTGSKNTEGSWRYSGKCTWSGMNCGTFCLALCCLVLEGSCGHQRTVQNTKI